MAMKYQRYRGCHVGAIGGLAVLISACASQPDGIEAQSVSTTSYETYDCTQISTELDRVNLRAAQLYESLENEADADAAQMAIGVVLFWPALLFLEGGDGPEAQEYARLKGERVALEQVAVARGCEIEEASVFEQEDHDCVAEGLTPQATTEIDWAKVNACEKAKSASIEP